MDYDSRTCLIATSIKCGGDWLKTYQAIKTRQCPSVEEGLELVSKVRSKTVTIIDADYPVQLRQSCPQPPIVLYYYGDLSLAQNPLQILSVVGSREPTEYASRMTQSLCAGIANRGYIIASGLARGIDTVAAEATASLAGKSIAVLGCGIERVYPLENKKLKDKIAANGLVLSEYPNFVAPEARNFPCRNRILACISQATLIAEAKPRSGTLITAAFALQFNRDLCVLPFLAGEEYVNNRLIKQGAALVENVEDLELLLNSRTMG